MRIVRIILITLWILVIFGLFLYTRQQQLETTMLEQRIQNSIPKMLPCAKLYGEYYSNVMILKNMPECKQLVDSIYDNSEFLKSYDNNHRKTLKQQQQLDK